MKMMKGISLFCLGSFLWVCGGKQVAQEKVVLLEEKIAAPKESLKTSSYFASVAYVPLETTDSSLIGNNPQAVIGGDKVYVGSNKSSCLVFDLKTGKFTGSIGSLDKGPRGYRSSADLWINPENGVLYFPGWKREFMKYSGEGEFLGVQKLPENAGDAASYSYLNANTLVVRCESLMGKVADEMLFFDDKGEVLKRFPGACRTDSLGGVSDIAAITIFNHLGVGLSRGSVALLKMKEAGKERIVMMSQPVFCHWNGATYYKDSYNDTVFRLTEQGKVPERVLDMGKYRLAPEERDSREARKEKGNINQIMESDRFLMFSYFFCPEGEMQVYRGIFDKATEETETALFKDGFTDDLNGFMPIHPVMENWDNSLIAFLQPIDILTWFEEHPEEAARLNPEILCLKQLKEDDNPVLVVATLKK